MMTVEGDRQMLLCIGLVLQPVVQEGVQEHFSTIWLSFLESPTTSFRSSLCYNGVHRYLAPTRRRLLRSALRLQAEKSESANGPEGITLSAESVSLALLMPPSLLTS
jgi:hypothetical protein